MGLTFEQQGARYREARDGIGHHRRLQAALEVTYGQLYARHGPGHPDVNQARQAVEAEVENVAWCQAAMIAVAEKIKGCTFAEAVAGDEPAVRHEAKARALAGGDT